MPRRQRKRLRAAQIRLQEQLVRLLQRTDLSAEEKRAEGQRMVREAYFPFVQVKRNQPNGGRR
jgi:hypothetical protein